MKSGTIVVLIVCSFLLPGSLCTAQEITAPEMSFFQLVGKTDWAVHLKSFTVSAQESDTRFELRIGDGRQLSYRAYRGGDPESGRFGPLKEKYAPRLSGLLNYALGFAEQEREGQFSMNLSWEDYPESIQKWARIWQASSLYKAWDTTDSHARYKKLVELISDFLKNEMQTVASGLGFESTGASMEKMTYQKAHRFRFYDDVLAPAGIPKDLTIPVPLMLNVLLKPLEKASFPGNQKPEPGSSFRVDYLFAAAKKDSTFLYCSFQRQLDEYEITGDRVHSGGAYTRIRPISQEAYRSIATRLVQGCIAATGADKREKLYFRMNLERYPRLYQEVVKRFTANRGSTPTPVIRRPQLPRLEFHPYDPSPDTNFRAAIKPFWDLIGYRFSSFQVSISSKRKAKTCPDYSNLLKPLGIKPSDKPALPDIVYMVVEKE
ncbi:MAG: hypothetical protein PVH87_24915 [Desulfobacteraceae bacterium]|jgi:hypothetical protein